MRTEYPQAKRYLADVPTDIGIHHLSASTPKLLRKYIYNYVKRGRVQYSQPIQIIVEYSQHITPNKVERDYVGRMLITPFGKEIYWEGKKDHGKVQADGSIMKR